MPKTHYSEVSEQKLRSESAAKCKNHEQLCVLTYVNRYLGDLDLPFFRHVPKNAKCESDGVDII